MSSTHWRLMGNHNQAGFDIAKSGRIKCIRAKFWCLWDLPITAALILSKLTEKNMWNVSKCLEILYHYLFVPYQCITNDFLCFSLIEAWSFCIFVLHQFKDTTLLCDNHTYLLIRNDILMHISWYEFSL